MITDGRPIEVVLRAPLDRSAGSVVYAFTGAFGGFHVGDGGSFVRVEGEGDDVVFIPITMIGAILADGGRKR